MTAACRSCGAPLPASRGVRPRQLCDGCRVEAKRRKWRLGNRRRMADPDYREHRNAQRRRRPRMTAADLGL